MVKINYFISGNSRNKYYRSCDGGDGDKAGTHAMVGHQKSCGVCAEWSVAALLRSSHLPRPLWGGAQVLAVMLLYGSSTAFFIDYVFQAPAPAPLFFARPVASCFARPCSSSFRPPLLLFFSCLLRVPGAPLLSLPSPPPPFSLPSSLVPSLSPSPSPLPSPTPSPSPSPSLLRSPAPSPLPPFPTSRMRLCVGGRDHWVVGVRGKERCEPV